MKVLVVMLAVVVGGAWCRMAGRLPGGYGVLSTTFSCNDRPFGYYADVENDCKAFHVCQPVFEEDGTLYEVAHFSFMCGQQAVFSQDSLTCSHPSGALPCMSESLCDHNLPVKPGLQVFIEEFSLSCPVLSCPTF
ncbi:hypothetical protein Pcinc_008980 [Petrolisthes cinctipes]|uniref:Chitin-binding type-2 domain-containing protein n=1 Tax=Petrolisthes cinctipes TaxID=88211 RepID=A0AAE1KWY7_PETCI|nr:hypothetical protein Pcinc_008980 [Petrolisthes cinctipes]